MQLVGQWELLSAVSVFAQARSLATTVTTTIRCNLALELTRTDTPVWLA